MQKCKKQKKEKREEDLNKVSVESQCQESEEWERKKKDVHNSLRLHGCCLCWPSTGHMCANISLRSSLSLHTKHWNDQWLKYALKKKIQALKKKCPH